MGFSLKRKGVWFVKALMGFLNDGLDFGKIVQERTGRLSLAHKSSNRKDLLMFRNTLRCLVRALGSHPSHQSFTDCDSLHSQDEVSSRPIDCETPTIIILPSLVEPRTACPHFFSILSLLLTSGGRSFPRSDS